MAYLTTPESTPRSSLPYRLRLLPGTTRTRRKGRVAGIFATGVQQVTATVNTSATLIWDSDSTSTTTFGPLGSQTTNNVLKDLIINNTGTATMYLGQSAVSGTQGLFVNPGGSVILYGYVATVGVTSAGNSDVYGITASGTTSAEVGLASIPNAVV